MTRKRRTKSLSRTYFLKDDPNCIKVLAYSQQVKTPKSQQIWPIVDTKRGVLLFGDHHALTIHTGGRE